MRAEPGNRPTALEWLALAGGAGLTVHYAWLLDDAYIYFRYADNLVFLGRGLVFNPGEYAEGYTSPGWMGLLVALRGIGLGYWDAVRGTAVASFALFWLAAVVTNRRLSPAAGPVLNLPLLFVSFNYPALCYFSSGTEAPLVQLAAAALALFVLRPGATLPRVVLAAAPLIRPELALALACAIAWDRFTTGRMPWRWIALAAAVNSGWLAFRVVYYADFFPTTFYLKNVTNPVQGLRFMHDTLRPYHLYEIGAGAVALVVVLARGGGTALHLRERFALLATAALITLYVVKVGGDPRHYRFLAFPFCLSLLALGGLAEHAVATFRPSHPRRVVIAAGLAVMALSFSFQPRQLSHHPVFLDERPRIIDGIADAAAHRVHPRLVVPSPWEGGRAIELRTHYAAWLSGRGAAISPLGRVLVNSICWDHYRHFDHWGIHSYGLTDAILARTPMPAERPAHKGGLVPLARDLAKVHRWWPTQPDVGMLRAAVDAGVAAAWIEANLADLEVIERKLYNRHRPLENLGLAFAFPGPVRAGPRHP